MAKRTTGGYSAAQSKPQRNRQGADNGDGEARAALAVTTDDKGRVFSHVRQKWLVETPEERVRQAYVVTLHNEYGFDLDQMDEEVHSLAKRGSGGARADVVIWRTAQDKADSKTPLIVVECKADNITIKAADYAQGEAYALYCSAPFFVTHNNRETRASTGPTPTTAWPAPAR
ncbi:MAG: type I restriction enzyme HsdR N-terminal domain-containing protein [Planctomycetales bacterium]